VWFGAVRCEQISVVCELVLKDRKLRPRTDAIGTVTSKSVRLPEEAILERATDLAYNTADPRKNNVLASSPRLPPPRRHFERSFGGRCEEK
jgi:hypothetical protein